MANHTSTKKRIRRDKKVRMANKGNMSKMRTLVKKCRKSADSGENNIELFKETQSYLTQCGRRGLIHHANASRKISKLSQLFNSVK